MKGLPVGKFVSGKIRRNANGTVDVLIPSETAKPKRNAKKRATKKKRATTKRRNSKQSDSKWYFVAGARIFGLKKAKVDAQKVATRSGYATSVQDEATGETVFVAKPAGFPWRNPARKRARTVARKRRK